MAPKDHMADRSNLSPEELTSGRRIARNTILNFAAQALPLALVVLALPLLIAQLGSDRFGVLAFLWTILALFGVSDIGIGYVMTRLVAECLGGGNRSDIPSIFWTCMSVLMAVGLFLMLAFYASIPWFAEAVLLVPEHLRSETRASLVVLSLCLPFSIGGTACRGLLEAYQQFALRSVIVVSNAAFMFLAPLLIALFTVSLPIITLGFLVSRIVIFAMYLAACLHVVPELRGGIKFKREFVGRIIRPGGWMTISNVASPLLQYGDRFLIGSLVSIAAVGYYFVPYELATRSLIVVGSLTTVLMPAFATSMKRDGTKASYLFEMGMKIGLIAILVPALAISVFAGPILSLWIGEEMAHNSAFVLQLLCIAVMFNALGIVALSFILGAGRPDLVAKIHVLQLFVYVPLAAWLIASFGLTGAALAAVIRIGSDALLMMWLARHLMPDTAPDMTRLFAFLGLALLVLTGALYEMPLPSKILYAAIVLPSYCMAAGAFLFSANERKALLLTAKSAVSGRLFRKI
jgi:O-antigen/teichoic acid export membrane protein